MKSDTQMEQWITATIYLAIDRWLEVKETEETTWNDRNTEMTLTVEIMLIFAPLLTSVGGNDSAPVCMQIL